ncbi:histidine kinase [Spongiivirga sp. MCCC 1A20706]|uniref:histidine kinase n=1 Tax=Spongiivirga sp. MCCC 1A20706 TaxID=3160963 RepID=UPI00397735E4
MNSFIHHPIFRILAPLFSGVMVYVLILMINNDVGQITQQFFGEELYVCVLLSYLIQESTRLLISIFSRFKKVGSNFLNYSVLVAITLMVSVILVTFGMYFYYKFVQGFEPSFKELTTFNGIFIVISCIYILLYVSHQFLTSVNTKKVEKELFLKELIVEDYHQFKKGVNPSLLFECLESLITIIEDESELTDDFVNHMATVYRYILSHAKKQLVSITIELEVLQSLVSLFNYLPYRNCELTIEEFTQDGLVVPGSLLSMVEEIIRSTIANKKKTLFLKIDKRDERVVLSYTPHERLIKVFNHNKLNDISKVYELYTDEELKMNRLTDQISIEFPLLTIKETAI